MVEYVDCKLMKRVYYFFRRVVKPSIKLSLKGTYPKDFFYGCTNLTNDFNVYVTDICEKSKIHHIFHRLANTVLEKKYNISVSLVSVIVQLTKIKNKDILFATVDSYGVALSILKSWNLLKDNKFVFNTIGLCDVLLENRDPQLLLRYKRICQYVDLFVSGASLTECKKMSKLLNLPLSKFQFIPFGIDTDYFKSYSDSKEDYVLIIGADRKRDWGLYKILFLSFPKVKFKIITHPGLINVMPDNVEIIYNLPIGKVKDYINKSLFLVILSKQNYHFAGQSTSFRAMSMSKAVIFTRSFGVDEYKFKNGRDCYLVHPGDWLSLKKYFNKLTKDKKLRETLEKNARKKIIKDLSSKQYNQKLIRLFNNL